MKENIKELYQDCVDVALGIKNLGSCTTKEQYIKDCLKVIVAYRDDCGAAAEAILKKLAICNALPKDGLLMDKADVEARIAALQKNYSCAAHAQYCANEAIKNLEHIITML